jgi:hypothetical protein
MSSQQAAAAAAAAVWLLEAACKPWAARWQLQQPVHQLAQVLHKPLVQLQGQVQQHQQGLRSVLSTLATL